MLIYTVVSFGGIIAEPMTDLIKVMSNLVDSKGKILIPGVYDMVAPLTDKENELYDAIDFSVEELNAASGSETSLHDNKQDILKHRWRFPSLSFARYRRCLFWCWCQDCHSS